MQTTKANELYAGADLHGNGNQSTDISRAANCYPDGQFCAANNGTLKIIAPSETVNFKIVITLKS
jgi:hypothetical protein